MGNFGSKVNNKSSLESPEQRKRRLEQEFGVLMPPSFVNHHGPYNDDQQQQSQQLPITTQAFLQSTQSIEPSLLNYLWATNPGTRILEDYLQPGISIQIDNLLRTNTRYNDSNNKAIGKGSLLLHLKPSNPLLSSLQQEGQQEQNETTTNISSTATTAITKNKEDKDTSQQGGRRDVPSVFQSKKSFKQFPNKDYHHSFHSSSILASHRQGPLRFDLCIPTTYPYEIPSFRLSTMMSTATNSLYGLTIRIPLSSSTTIDSTHAIETDQSINSSPHIRRKDPGGWIEAKYKGYWSLSSDRIKGNIKNNDNGVVEAETSDGFNVMASTWMSFGHIHDCMMLARQKAAPSSESLSFLETKKNTNKSSNISYSTNNTSPSPVHVNLQAAIEYQESLVSVQTSLPLEKYFKESSFDSTLSNNEFPSLDTLLSINLNYDRQNASVVSPPLWLSLKQKQNYHNTLRSSWTLNLSQILTFDRPVLNPLDDRAPSIRQTLGWVVQVEKEGNDIRGNQDSMNGISQTSWQAGATFQWNRNFATKALLIDGHRLTYSAIWKRWAEPRVTLSWIQCFDFTTGRHQQVGIGLELEASAAVRQDSELDTLEEGAAEYPGQPSVLPKAGPQSKIQIPSQYTA